MARRPANTGTGPAPSLAYLATQVTGIRVDCLDCGRHKLVPIQDLITRLGPEFLFIDAKQKFRCSDCGSGKVDSMPAWPSMMHIGQKFPVEGEPNG